MQNESKMKKNIPWYKVKEERKTKSKGRRIILKYEKGTNYFPIFNFFYRRNNFSKFEKKSKNMTSTRKATMRAAEEVNQARRTIGSAPFLMKICAM